MGILSDAKVRRTLIRDCGESLMKLDTVEFVVEPLYYEWGFSESPIVKLRSGIVGRLKTARDFLPPGWNFKIWDGFRTLATQKILYENYWNQLAKANPDWSDTRLAEAVEIFVAPPSHDPLLPAPHNTGGAVDLTLVDASGDEVAMGTAFDEFNERSYSAHFKDGKIHDNRLLLKKAMAGAGFVNYPEEWWHFSHGDQLWAAGTGADFAIYGGIE